MPVSMIHDRSTCLLASYPPLFASLCIVAPAFAGVPQYTQFQLQARSNLCANVKEGTHNLPCDHFFANATPVVNDSGEWTVKLDVMAASASQGILYGVDGTAEIVYTSQPDDNLSDPWINNAGLIAWPQFISAENGLFQYNTDTSTGGLLLSAGTASWGSVVVNDNGAVGFRVSGGVNEWNSYLSPTVVEHAPLSEPYSFLFSPHMNNARQMAGRVSLTGSPTQDQIRRINVDGSFTIIAVDRDTDINSPYTGFDASRPAIADDGRVAFIANLFGGGRGVFLSDGTITTTIATTIAGQGVTVIDFFPPHVNDNGLVVFRGRDAAGLRAIFVGDGTTIRRVIGEHDIVPSDNGPARIDQNDPSHEVFGGAPTINEQGDIAFHCTLTPPDDNQIEWGSGIYIAYATPRTQPGDADGNGVVDVDDLVAVILAWGACPAPPQTCPADFDGNGAVDVDDLIAVILNWG